MIVLIPSFKTISSIRTYSSYVKDIFLIQRLAEVKLDEIANRMRGDEDYFISCENTDGNFENFGYSNVEFTVKIKEVRNELKCIYVTASFYPYENDRSYKLETTVAEFVSKRR